MSATFAIETEWEAGSYGTEVIRATCARLRIVTGAGVATRVEDEDARSVREAVRLPAYPLALWLASSWWRLRWEPAPVDDVRSLEWRMAHEMSAAGEGLVWPRLAFEYDGEFVEAICTPSSASATSAIRYLEDFRVSIPPVVFERAVDEFVRLVLSRLQALDVQNTDLQVLWQELCEERAGSRSSSYRRLEAQLGYEPDEGPRDAVERLIQLADEVGEDAISEIAPVCAGDDPIVAIESLVEAARSANVQGIVDIPFALRDQASSRGLRDSTPWERGRTLAHQARQAWNLDGQPVDDHTLASILGVAPDYLESRGGAGAHPAVGLAVRDRDTGTLRYALRRSRRQGRRFEAARLLVDHLVSEPTDGWLPSTDAATVRQKVQRAFAAEFLCPIDQLRGYLSDDFSQDNVEEAGEYFGVSPLAVQSHLANNRLVPRF